MREQGAIHIQRHEVPEPAEMMLRWAGSKSPKQNWRWKEIFATVWHRYYDCADLHLQQSIWKDQDSGQYMLSTEVFRRGNCIYGVRQRIAGTTLGNAKHRARAFLRKWAEPDKYSAPVTPERDDSGFCAICGAGGEWISGICDCHSLLEVVMGAARAGVRNT